MGAVFKREMKAYFTMPIGYIVIAVILILMYQIFPLYSAVFQALRF